MLKAYLVQGHTLSSRTPAESDRDATLHAAVWIDLFAPTPEEERLVEAALGISIPTRDEMQEIEVSSRLYVENGARFMTATVLCATDTDQPRTAPVTFILFGEKLVTVRYDEPRAFSLVAGKLSRVCSPAATGMTVLSDLFDVIIDRAADLLERISADIDALSHDVFEPERAAHREARTYRDTLKRIGRRGDLTSRVRESLVSIGRLVLFLANDGEGGKVPKDMRGQLSTMQRDLQSLSDHASYLGGKITFLLDALLGMVSLEQNNIIKLFSVAAVVFMPPTLVASIYGMNFRNMPELEWAAGYPMALGLMLVAAIVPYVFFKWRKWL